jgi:hypothetical protein
MSVSMEDALTEAILWAQDEPQDNYLADVDFGKRSDAPGYWWTMQFTRTVRNSEVLENHQDMEARLRMIVAKWCRVKAWLDEQEAS